MFSYLQPADKPVVEGLERFELRMGASQAEYNPLRCIPGNTPNGERLSRWTLTPEQRQAIADGADIFLELCTFNNPMNPIRMAVADEINSAFVTHGYKLDELEKAKIG